LESGGRVTIAPDKAGRILRFGTRGSLLARAQTDHVIDRLSKRYPEVACRPIVIRTEGDIDTTSPLTAIGGRGVFTTALQEALRGGTIDVAVHSAKDLPTDRPADLRLIAFLAREDARDVFVSKHGRQLAELGPNPLIGTSSRRRAVQVLRLRPDARITDLRGNIDTRLKKARQTELDGIVLAAAGVDRMGWQDQITEYLPLEIAVPSPGQGALAIEIRADDDETAAMVADLDEPLVSLAVRVERALLRGIGGGCTTPVGAHATIEGSSVRLSAMLASDDGQHAEWVTRLFGTVEAELRAESLAGELLRTIQARQAGTDVAIPGNDARPLAGRRVLITRGTEDDPFPARLAALGATPVVLPTIRIAPVPDGDPITAALQRLRDGGYDWVVFTSGNAVEQFLAHLDRHGMDRRTLGWPRVAAVGRSTARRLESHGVPVALIPETFTGEALVSALTAAGMRGRRVLIPHGDLARETVPAGLSGAGARVDRVEVYRTVAAGADDPARLEQIRGGECEMVVFLSPSAVDNLAALLGGTLSPLRGAAIACIGPVTAKAVDGEGG
jgi:hydroxymethylbilane synthase